MAPHQQHPARRRTAAVGAVAPVAPAAPVAPVVAAQAAEPVVAAQPVVASQPVVAAPPVVPAQPVLPAVPVALVAAPADAVPEVVVDALVPSQADQPAPLPEDGSPAALPNFNGFIFYFTF